MPRTLLFLLGILVAMPFFCQSSTSLAEAQERLGKRDYARAAVLLDSAAGADQVSAAYYLMLGNAHYEAGAPGKAILAYERGLRLRPADAALRNNLRFVREEAGVAVSEPPAFFLLRWWQMLGAFLGTTVAFIVALAWWWVALALALFWYLRRARMEEKRRFILLPFAGVCLGLAVLFYALGASRYGELHREDVAILTAPTASLRVAPMDSGSVEGQLAEGSRLRITDRVGAYLKVQADDGRQGYVLAEELTIV